MRDQAEGRSALQLSYAAMICPMHRCPMHSPSYSTRRYIYRACMSLELNGLQVRIQMILQYFAACGLHFGMPGRSQDNTHPGRISKLIKLDNGEHASAERCAYNNGKVSTIYFQSQHFSSCAPLVVGKSARNFTPGGVASSVLHICAYVLPGTWYVINRTGYKHITRLQGQVGVVGVEW